MFHQILGWHHLVCVTEHCRPATIQGLQQQNTQDGYFHLVVWLVSLAGTAMLFRAGRDGPRDWSARALCGGMLAGWGFFNVIEGLIDHQILGIHHVLPGHPHQFLWDMLFLTSGLLFVFLGERIIRAPDRAHGTVTWATPRG